MLKYGVILQHEEAWHEAVTLLDAALSGFNVAVGATHEDTRKAAAQMAELLPLVANALLSAPASAADKAELEEAARKLLCVTCFEEAAAMYRPVLERLPKVMSF